MRTILLTLMTALLLVMLTGCAAHRQPVAVIEPTFSHLRQPTIQASVADAQR